MLKRQVHCSLTLQTCAVTAISGARLQVCFSNSFSNTTFCREIIWLIIFFCNFFNWDGVKILHSPQAQTTKVTSRVFAIRAPGWKDDLPEAQRFTDSPFSFIKADCFDCVQFHTTQLFSFKFLLFCSFLWMSVLCCILFFFLFCMTEWNQSKVYFLGKCYQNHVWTKHQSALYV